MFVVSREILMLDFLPLRPIDDREERIGIGELGMDVGDIHFVRPAQCLAIDQGTADNKYFLFFLAFIDSQGKQFTKSASGKVVSTTFLRLGSAPLGSDSKVLRPMRTACPVVSSLKRFISLGRCQSNCKFLPIALSSAIAAMIDIVLILFN